RRRPKSCRPKRMRRRHAARTRMRGNRAVASRNRSRTPCSAPAAARPWWKRWPSRPRAPWATRSAGRSCAASSAASRAGSEHRGMSRWRPPPEQSTALVTPEGHARLKAELDDLWRVRRPEVVRALSAAAAEGDRSENAEYTYRKNQLGEIDRRVRYLSKRLQALRVVD